MRANWPFVVTFLIAWLTADLMVPVVRRFAYMVGKVDKPGTRKIHKDPIPRMGGIAICVGCYASLLGIEYLHPGYFTQMPPEWRGVIFGGLLIFIVGLLDDLYDLKPKVKLAGQIVAASTAFWLGVKITFISNPFGGMVLFPEWLSFVLTVVWLVAITNTINLIDGLDGLAGGVSTIAGITLFMMALDRSQSLSALVAIALVGATLGFLRYNFNPAKIFMGDCGSLFLGFMLGALSITGAMKVAATVAVFLPILILGIPIFDTTFAIVRRLLARKPIFQADKGHLHHRLLNIGLSQRRAVLLIYGFSALLGGIALHLVHFSQARVLIVVSLLLIVWGAIDFRLFLPRRMN
ncbi:MAG: undecaprenyl-phosphate alpha-N-acetylglucosaminyl 1-phosphate transferase [Candidatus Melainabacteria bacterium HGW-Melainabacteria-1]|nr:MAG: undecaprenyl-phosphate alpha-N-acetylglucosaminyl 1-phosphate transferase [Candidatus Melainabacteria bacterium HGW-Melainabacteria-1]